MKNRAHRANALPAPLREQLGDARRRLLRVHKALLEDERVRYERVHGRVAGSGTFLQLVIHDPWFAWLHPLSELVVQIEEALAAEATPAADAEALLGQARALLRADENGTMFQQHYHRALQEVPAAVMAHADAMRTLNVSPGKG
jgi:type II secretory pathway component PulM